MERNPRVFGFLSVGTTAQPLVGTTLTNAIVPCGPDTATAGRAGQSVEVASSAIFQVGDFVNLLPAVGTTPAREIQVPITAIPDATHIVIFNSAPHNAGDFVQLDWACADIRIQISKAQAPSGSIFLGVDATVTALGANAFDDLSISATFVQPYFFANAGNVSNIWIIAANRGELYLPSLWRS